MPDVRDTTGFFLDDEIDDEGEGAYQEELVAGPNPGKKVFRVVDSRIETINLQDPVGLASGVDFQVTTNGLEASQTLYDARQQASLYLVNLEFNTESAPRFNRRARGSEDPEDRQPHTFAEVLSKICAKTNLIFDLSKPRPAGLNDYAGPFSFRNTPLPQAVTQVLEAEGNSLWTVSAIPVAEAGPPRFPIEVIERDPTGASVPEDQRVVGKIAVNVAEQSVTGADPTTGRGALVTDKDFRGDKKQRGGPAWYGRDAPDPDAADFGALPPLELALDASDLDRVATKIGESLDFSYRYTEHNDDKAGFHAPKGPDGKIIRARARLVQKNQMMAGSITFRDPFAPPALELDKSLLSHPNESLSFEVKRAAPPTFFQTKEALKKDQAARRAELQGLILAANGAVTREIDPNASTTKKIRSFKILELDYSTDNGDGTSTARVMMGIIGFYEPEWVPISGLVDLERGELILDPGTGGTFPDLFSFTSDVVLASFSTQAVHGGSAQAPVPFYFASFTSAVEGTLIRAHVVTCEEMPRALSPPTAIPPYGAVESGEYERHNVSFNAAKIEGYPEPEEPPRDDSARMQQRADGLARALSLPSMARGQITIFPGDRTLRIGQPANGGVIVRIVHDFVPYFKTTFWLEGTPDVDALEQRFNRRKIGEHEGLSQVNSAQVQAAKRVTESRGGQQAARVEPHNHSNELEGGSKLGDVSVTSLLVDGVGADGQPAIRARKGLTTGVLDLKWVPGVGRLVSGGLLVKVLSIGGDGKVSVRVHDDGSLPVVDNVIVLLGGVAATSVVELAGLVEEDQIRPLFFIENADQKVPPKPALVIEGKSRLIIDHFSDDEDEDSNISTEVFATKVTANGKSPDLKFNRGDLDDLMACISNFRRGSGFDGNRLRLFMAEKEHPDLRKGFVCGPFSTLDRDSEIDYAVGPDQERVMKEESFRFGNLADVFRFSHTYDAFFPSAGDEHGIPLQKLTIRTDTWFSDRETDLEGSLDFYSLHDAWGLIRGASAISVGIRGCPVVFDDQDWGTNAAQIALGEPGNRGLRWKVIPICDGISADSRELPTAADACHQNQSTEVWEGDLSDFGLLSDLFRVKDGRLRILMNEEDPCDLGSAVLPPCAGVTDFRTGFVTNGTCDARLSDAFTYHDPGLAGRTRLDLRWSNHFKLTTALDGPLYFWGSSAESPVGFHPENKDYVYGRLALDAGIGSAFKCGAPGAWVIEIPFDICELDTFLDWEGALIAHLNSNYAAIRACFVALGRACPIADIPVSGFCHPTTVIANPGGPVFPLPPFPFP